MRFDGIYYVCRWGFSLNEGRFPNVHLSWLRGYWLYFYVAFSPRWKWWGSI